MIFYRNKVEEVALGRHVQRLSTEFVMRKIPDWLTVPSSTTYQNNGIKTPSAVSVIETCLFDVKEMEQVSIELFNIKFNSDTATASIKMLSEDGSKEIGLYSDPTTGKNLFKYVNNDTEVIADNTVGYIGDIMKFRFMAYNSGSGNFGSRPRNLRLSLMPQCGFAHIIEMGVPSYTRQDLNEGATAVDWSGRWKFVAQSNGYICMSGAELMIQQNI